MGLELGLGLRLGLGLVLGLANLLRITNEPPWIVHGTPAFLASASSMPSFASSLRSSKSWVGLGLGLG